MDNQPTQIPTEVKTFLENLLKDSNMLMLDDAMKEEMIQELYARLDNYLTSVIVENLKSEQIEQFIKMNEEKKSKQEVEQYLKENMPNSQDVFAKAFIDFRDMYLGNVSVAREKKEPSLESIATTPATDTGGQVN